MIQYSKNISPEEYLELRKKVGWLDFPVEEAKAGIDNAYMILCARDGEKAVGLLRLLWDGGYVALISDVMVDPEYQGQGIGRHLVEACIQRVKDDMKPGYKVQLDLLAAPGKELFYKKFGFIERPNEKMGSGMTQWFKPEE